jgi:tetratricopeptide (TPR) repeat protein
LPAVDRRLQIVERLTDPWEVGDALQTAADTALFVGRFRDALRWADEGFERSRTGPDVWRACLAWRGVARFQLGDWDGMLEDLRLLEAAAASTRFGSAAYFHVVARCTAALLYELRGERTASDLLLTQVLDDSPGTATVRRLPWLARLAAHRGSRKEAFDWLEHETAGKELARAQLLAARCDIVAELGAWHLADDTISDSRAFAELALVEALPLHADRLEGRAALAREDAALAVEALTRARDGFAQLGARWEDALASLWLAEALRARGSDGEARAVADAALSVFAELRSVRELEHARTLMSEV